MNADNQHIAAELAAIEEMVKSELEGMEATVIHHDEIIDEIDGRSKENAVVIRAVQRRFEKAIRKLEVRVAQLETD